MIANSNPDSKRSNPNSDTNRKKNSSRGSSFISEQLQEINPLEDKSRIRNRSTEIHRNEHSPDDNSKIKEHLYKALSTVNQKLNVKTEPKEKEEFIAPNKGLGSFINKPEGQPYSNRSNKPKLPQVQKITKKQSKIMELTNLMDNIASLNQKESADIKNDTQPMNDTQGNKKRNIDVKVTTEKKNKSNNLPPYGKSRDQNLENCMIRSNSKDKETLKSQSNSNNDQSGMRIKDDYEYDYDNGNEEIETGKLKSESNKSYRKQTKYIQRDSDDNANDDNNDNENEEEEIHQRGTEYREGGIQNSFGNTKLIRDEYPNYDIEESKETGPNPYLSKEYSNTSHYQQPSSNFRSAKRYDNSDNNLIVPVKCSVDNMPKAQVDLLKYLSIEDIIKYSDDDKGHMNLSEINVSGVLNMLLIKDFEISKLRSDLTKEKEKQQKSINEYNNTGDKSSNRRNDTVLTNKLRTEVNELTDSKTKLIESNKALEAELNKTQLLLKQITKKYQDDIIQYEALTKSLFESINNI